MASGHHLEKSKNHDIPATTWPILLKFGMEMHLNPSHHISRWNCQNLKIQDGIRPTCWKLQYLSSHLMDRWNFCCYTYCPYRPYQSLKFRTHSNARWQTATNIKMSSHRRVCWNGKKTTAEFHIFPQHH